MSLNDFTGDLLFAADVAGRWLDSQGSFLDLARQQVRSIRNEQRHIHRSLARLGIDKIIEDYSDGEMPVVSLAEFDDGSSTAEETTYEMVKAEDGTLLAIILTDNKDRVTLFTMYPDSGGTIVVNIGYDNKGNESVKTLSV